MRRISDEERALFLSALSGRMPAKKTRPATKSRPSTARPVAHKAAKKPMEPDQPTRGRRQTTPDEMDLFLFAVTGQTPVQETPKAKAPKTKSTPTAPALKPPKSTVGLDGNTLRRLTRGELAPSARLDLHGLTEAGAHGALCAFVLAAHKRGDRLVLIVTGKGSSREGVLKQMVPRWLDEAPMVKVIAEKRWAHRRHGGEGALYVYLRKP